MPDKVYFGNPLRSKCLGIVEEVGGIFWEFKEPGNTILVAGDDPRIKTYYCM